MKKYVILKLKLILSLKMGVEFLNSDFISFSY